MGRKTANVVLSVGFNFYQFPYQFAVDTHVGRIYEEDHDIVKKSATPLENRKHSSTLGLWRFCHLNDGIFHNPAHQAMIYFGREAMPSKDRNNLRSPPNIRNYMNLIKNLQFWRFFCFETKENILYKFGSEYLFENTRNLS